MKKQSELEEMRRKLEEKEKKSKSKVISNLPWKDYEDDLLYKGIKRFPVYNT